MAGVAGVALSPSGCARPDWRADAIAQAETKIRAQVADPAAQFSRVQLTGDNATGQTCGWVSARTGADALEHTVRFIVYIDATAGPFIEGEPGQNALSQEGFEGAWQADCVKEGYDS